MELEAKVPGVVAQDKAGNLFISEDRDTVAVLAVGFALHFSNYILPAVQEIRASGAVGDYHVRFVGLHAFKFLMSV